MKKLLITMIALVGLVAFSGCSKDEPTNLFKGTKWTAPDDIAEMIYGGTCTTSIEFLTDSKCQEIRVRKTRMFSDVDVEEGTYSFKGNSVSWTIGEKTISGKVSGSVLSTDMGTISGGKRTYTRE